MAGHAVLDRVRAARGGPARSCGPRARSRSTTRRAEQRGDRHRDRRAWAPRRPSAKWPSPTCWRRHASSSSTTLTSTRIVEVGDGRVVERQVPVLTDAEAAEVERVRRGGAARTARTRRRDRARRRRSRGRPRGARRRRCARACSGGSSPGDRRRCRVLVHVEAGDPGPVDRRVARELVEERELRVAAREHDVRRAPRRRSLDDRGCGSGCGDRAERRGVGDDADLEVVHLARVTLAHANCGSHGFVAAKHLVGHVARARRSRCGRRAGRRASPRTPCRDRPVSAASTVSSWLADTRRSSSASTGGSATSSRPRDPVAVDDAHALDDDVVGQVGHLSAVREVEREPAAARRSSRHSMIGATISPDGIVETSSAASISSKSAMWRSCHRSRSSIVGEVDAPALPPLRLPR